LQGVQSLRDTFLSPPEADSSSHTEEPWGLSHNGLCSHKIAEVNVAFTYSPRLLRVGGAVASGD